jgi:hypothetical protein
VTGILLVNLGICPWPAAAMAASIPRAVRRFWAAA